MLISDVDILELDILEGDILKFQVEQFFLWLLDCNRVTLFLIAETRCDQGCQIFLGTAYQNVVNIYQITINYLYQMATKYTKWP
jgi:hypothetical protein